MQRRTLIKSLAIGTPVVALGGAALWLTTDRSHPGLSIEATLANLDRLSSGPIHTSGNWNPHQVFNHCAQSVEYSITGFPESESELFQNTAGALAFSVFAARGAMSHNLAEPIPGAPQLPVEGDEQLALRRLISALESFDGHNGPLQPHFAFGELNKGDYALAHVLHINNHLQEFPSA